MQKKIKQDKPKTETKTLMCILTADEQRVRGIELAAAIKTLDELDVQKREVTEKIKAAEARRDVLATVVKFCQEERPVECVLEPDYDADTMTVRRTDTGTVVCVRQLTLMERQQELDLED